jgi:hypothetical protein
MPYIVVVEPGGEVSYRLLVRNNLERAAEYAARLLPPPGWRAAPAFRSLPLPPGGQGEIPLSAVAPAKASRVRRLITAEILIDGVSQGPLVEGLVTVREGGR